MNELSHTYEWVTSHTNEPCHTCEWVMSRIWILHEMCRICIICREMFHYLPPNVSGMGHVTYMNSSWDVLNLHYLPRNVSIFAAKCFRNGSCHVYEFLMRCAESALFAAKCLIICREMFQEWVMSRIWIPHEMYRICMEQQFRLDYVCNYFCIFGTTPGKWPKHDHIGGIWYPPLRGNYFFFDVSIDQRFWLNYVWNY